MLDAVRAALVTAYRRDWKIASTQNVTADINLETGLARIYLEKIVVKDTEAVEDSETQIPLPEARVHKPKITEGDAIFLDVTPRNFGRIAAQTAKQVITQRLREAERESQFNRFIRQENEIIIGTIQSITPHGITLHLERTEEALMPRREQIPGERYTLHQKIRVYVLEVRRSARGPEIIVSRSHPRMLHRLLELEVPEIRAGQVEVKAIAREAGGRSKVAVIARQPGLDPVGACVGMRGIRIQTISRELHGERIDVLEWDSDLKTFIANALSMNQVLCVSIDEHASGGRTASVVVMDDQLSLAIGRSGQNARLAAKLTGWRVDIQGATEAAVWTLEQINKKPELLDALRSDIAALIPRLAAIMRSHEDTRYPYTDEERRIIRDTVSAVREALIARREMEQHAAIRQARERRSAQQRIEDDRREARREAMSRVPDMAYETSLDTLDLPEKVLSNLLQNGLQNVGELMERVALGDEALLMLNGVGARALGQIKEAVEDSELNFIEVKAAFEAEEAVDAAETVEETPEEAVEAVIEETVEVLDAAQELVEVEEIVAEVAEEPVEEIAAAAEPDVSAEVAIAEEAEPESVAEEAEEASGLEAIFDPASIGLAYEYEEIEVEDDTADDDTDESDKDERRKGKRKKKGRAVLYDEETGETYVVRKRRGRTRDQMWDEYGDF